MKTIRGLPSLVRKQFKLAQESGALKFYETQVALLHCEGVPFQLRYSPALANKPKSNKSVESKHIDPFENPDPDLFVLGVDPAHYLVLNKFPVIPDHFILATKDFKNQTDLLEADDIAAAYQCIQSYKAEGEQLFGFFNSGEHSGASQPHRHIQFLPVDSMRTGIDSTMSWDVLSNSLSSQPRPDLPFRYFASPLPTNATAAQTHEIYRELYNTACQNSDETIAKGTEQESQISYNLGLTDQSIVLCPRKSEGFKIEGSKGEMLGPITLNGTVLGGTLLVKTEDEWIALQNDSMKLMNVLKAIGVPAHKHDHEGRL